MSFRDVIAKFRPVLGVYARLIDELSEIYAGKCNREILNEVNVSNIPVYAYFPLLFEKTPGFEFCTVRRNELVKVQIVAREIETRFFDYEGSIEFCLEISIQKKLANPEKFQQDFSMFLATDKHLIDLIVEIIWPHIDASVKKEEKRVRQVNRLNRETIPREDHPRYSLRARKNDKESQDADNSRLRKFGSTR